MTCPCAVHREAAAVEDELVVSADLVHVHDRDVVTLRRAGEDLAPELPLAHVIRRGVDAEQDFGPGLGQFLDRIAEVQPAFPELLVVPGVLADRERRRTFPNRIQRLSVAGTNQRASSNTS